MPPRHHYWTIILEGTPTAFRAHTQEELMPTLRQLQARHPDAVMKWFARGRLWESQDEERAEAFAKRRATGPPRDRRPREWRPGGEHKDPRERFKIPRDEKRRRFAEKLWGEQKDLRPPDEARPPRPERPRFDRPPHTTDRPPGGFGGKPRWNRPEGSERPGASGRPQGGGRPPAFGRPPGSGRPPASGRPPGSGRPPASGRPPGSGRPPAAGRPPGSGRPPASGRPAGSGRPHGTGRPPGSGRPQGGRPPGARKPAGGGGKGGGGRSR